MAQLQKAIAQLMESRQEQRPPRRDEQPGDARVLSGLDTRVPADELAVAAAFARELLARAPEDLAEGEALAALVASAFAFLRDRGRTAMAVRVFTPQPERDGWSTPLTVIESVTDDRPFIVNSLRDVIQSAGGDVRVLLHPILGLERRRDGTPERIGTAADFAARESFVHMQVANLAPSPALQQQVAERLRVVMLATGDYRAMRERVAAAAALLRAAPLAAAWNGERDEAAAWLDWLGEKSFVFLGYREYDLDGSGDTRRATVRDGSGLGILRGPAPSRWATGEPLPEHLRARLDAPPLLLISKTNARSPIHRAAPMDDIAVKEIDAAGRVVALRRVVGLFTAKAYADAPSEMPLLRRRLASMLTRAGVIEDSHDWRDLTALFDSFPREALLASGVDDVHAAMRAILDAEARPTLGVECHADAGRRGLFVLVLVPRARFSTELHDRITAALRERLGAPILLDHLALDERPVARLHYHCAVDPATLASPPLAALRERLGALLRTWDDELRDTLAAMLPGADSARLAARYRAALPAAYKASTEVADAARDVRAIEALLASGRTQIELPDRLAGRPWTLKLYLRDEALVLSDFVPVLEHFGLRVLGQDVIELALPDAPRLAMHRFTVEPAAPAATVAPRAAAELVAGLHAVRDGRAASDPLNALVLSAGLDWRAVWLLRAYAYHARQAAVGSAATLHEALAANPDCAAALVAAFAARFDPAGSRPPAERLAGTVATADAALAGALAAVPSLAHDRILRAMAATIVATLRTTYYAVEPGQPVAFKLDAARIPHLPTPRPAFETWVYGVGVQGIHLRAGRVARGGIRFSDRRDDFRAEILALLRTQVVKNAVTVPVGAKGGFVLTGERAAGEAGVVEAAYQAFVEALLAITDNLDRGRPVTPAGVVAYDDPDPYLVIAADKGTAAFSDLANALAAARGFWLGDAFAAGGTHGYDHKRLGITARGAWECARQHFRELGRDLDREPVTVAGIGDMSGDVFGNGLLRSRHLRLLAAFDHRHVFIDPDPDPARACRERERLFALPRSTWADYAASAFSPGGGVYPRDAKAIALSPAARTLLGLDEAAPPGEAVVRAVLRLDVDLLWSGGIGTYVKASDETQADVGDPANDAVRVDARDLRAAVIVEGGNLGLTQRARIEYALAGGRINTDAIDNSAGVDCSDHEVNVKIALQPLVAGGELALEDRHRLLAELAEPVCEAVLTHNRAQARALSLDQRRSRTALALFRDLISILESEAGLDRRLAGLPTREALRARRGVYLGLTRPELAVLLANTKLDLQRRLRDSPLVDATELEPLLRSYFPTALTRRFPAAARQHPLRREIVAVQLANRLLDSMGMTFLVRVVRDTSCEVQDAVRAWVEARLLADADALEAELAAARDRLSDEADQRAAMLLEDALARATVWLVEAQPSGEPLGALLQTVAAPVGTLLGQWPRLRGDAHGAEVEALQAVGVPAGVADRLVCLGALDEMLEITVVAGLSGAPLTDAAEAHRQVGAALDLDWLRRGIFTALDGEDRWQGRAAAGLQMDLRDARRRLTIAVLAALPAGAPVEARLGAFAAAHRDQFDSVVGLARDSRASGHPGLPALLVLLRELTRLAEAGGGERPW